MLSTGALTSTTCSLRKSLESSTSVAKQQVDVQTKAAEKSQADVLAEQKKHEEERGILVTKVGELQGANDKQATEIANLSNKIKQQEDDFSRHKPRYPRRPSSANSAIRSRKTSSFSIGQMVTSPTSITNGGRSWSTSRAGRVLARR